MDNTIDLLQIKIEKAKSELAPETQNAINSVDWKNVILAMRETKGYTFEQLGSLELETELLLAGLLKSEEYPRELESRMGINKSQVSELVNEMNEEVFTKIKEELIKITDRKKLFEKSSSRETEPIVKSEMEKLGIKIIPEIEKIEKPILPQKMEPEKKEVSILAQKLAGPVQSPSTKTEHSLDNLTKTSAPQAYTKNNDPYRLTPEE